MIPVVRTADRAAEPSTGESPPDALVVGARHERRSGAAFDVRADLRRRLVYCRMTGTFTKSDCQAWAQMYRERGTNEFAGCEHATILDMRGLKTMHPSVAALVGEEIAHARRNGVVLFAHISDDVVQRLQIARIARQYSPEDDIAIEVESVEEAFEAVERYAKFLDDRAFDPFASRLPRGRDGSGPGLARESGPSTGSVVRSSGRKQWTPMYTGS